MIIAEIGISKFLLNDIKSAEMLLRIIAEATQINDTYVGPEYRKVVYEDFCRADINISVWPKIEILSYSDAMDLKESYNHK